MAPGGERRPTGRLLPWIAAAAVLMLLLGATLWIRQQEGARRSAETRAEQAEAQLRLAEASITAIVRVQAIASATAAAEAAARGSDPGPAVERALALVLAIFQDPTPARQRALADAFSPTAAAVFRSEIDRLTQSSLRLGGQSAFTVDVLDTTAAGADRATVRTRERWIYDERDASGQRVRCVTEQGELTYTVRRAPAAGSAGWIVDAIEIGPSQRGEC